MEFDSFARPVWQLPVHAAETYGNAYIPATAKYHCFVDGFSLCGKYGQHTDSYDEGITVESGVALQTPQAVCKRCYKKWLRRYLPEEAAAQKEGVEHE